MFKWWECDVLYSENSSQSHFKLEIWVEVPMREFCTVNTDLPSKDLNHHFKMHYFILAVLVHILFHVCSPDHQKPAPNTGVWRSALAFGRSRSLCCGTRSTLWGLDWTCLSSLCSPVGIQQWLNNILQERDTCFSQKPIFFLIYLQLCLDVNLASFWYADD